jgi:uncharacterized protein YdaU (DUF1376 family)
MEQGAYRNLIDEALLRGGVIPNDDRLLARACGDPLEWPAIREKVLRWFRPTPDGKGWTNDTAAEVVAELAHIGQRQTLERERKKRRRGGTTGGTLPGIEVGQGAGQEAGHGAENPPRPPYIASLKKSQERNEHDNKQNRELIDSYNEIIRPPRGITYTPGNLKASSRFYTEGYVIDQARRVFAAVRARATATAAWCDDHNREFEFLVRPPYIHHRSKQLTPGPLDKILNELATGRKADDQ